MATPSPTWTRALALLAVLFAVLSTGNAINKGGDAAVFFEGGRRFLAAEPLYAGSSAADGFIGPPFQAAFFAPFAFINAVSPVAARLLWHALNLACFGLGVWWSVAAWNAARSRLGLSELTWLPMLFAPLAAILLPLQTNFEHQNMNALLLAFIAGATVQLLIGSSIVAGILIGVAAALKAFPALLIVYLLVRRHWTAALAAIASAAALSIVLPLGVYGYAGFMDLARTFWRLGNSGWPVRGNNQSLVAAIDRLTTGHFGIGDVSGVRVAAEAPRRRDDLCRRCCSPAADPVRHAAEDAARAASGARRDRKRDRARDPSVADRVGSLLDDDVSGVPDYLRERRSSTSGERGAVAVLGRCSVDVRVVAADAGAKWLQLRAGAISGHNCGPGAFCRIDCGREPRAARREGRGAC